MPELTISLHSLAVALFTICTAAAVGAPLLSLVNELYGWTTRRVFADKLSQQMARLAVLVAFITLVAMGVTLYFLLGSILGMHATHSSSFHPSLIVPVGTGLFSLVLLLVYTSTFRALRKVKIVHLALILLALVLMLFQHYTFALGVDFLTRGSVVRNISDLFGTPLSSHLMPFAAQTLLMAPGAAGCMGLIYLLMRRTKDDFGRDYYRWAAPAAAKWALVFPFHFAALAWIYSLSPHPARAAFTEPVVLAVLGGALVLCLLAVVLWILVVRSEHPMRLKGRMILAGLLALISVGLTGYAYIGPLANLLF